MQKSQTTLRILRKTKKEKEAQDENQATTILQQWIQTMQQHGKYPRPTDYDEPKGLE